MKIADAKRRLSSLRREYGEYEPAFKELSRFLAPTRGEFDLEGSSKGAKLEKGLIDSDPMRAVEIMSAGMMGGVTSPFRRWYDLAISPAPMMDAPGVRDWLETVTGILEDIFRACGLYGVLHGFFQETVVFGNGAFIMEPDYETVVRLTPLTVGEFYWGGGQGGKIDAFGRDFRMTVADLVDTFGLERVGPSVKMQYERGDLDEWHTLHHLIVPNTERKPEQKDNQNKKYASVYWLDESYGEGFLRESGYDDFPVISGRWELKNASELYGKGPGWKTIGDVKMLQKMQKTKITALDKNANPPMMVSSNVQGEVNLQPGGLTHYNGTTDSAIKPAYQIAIDLNALENSISEVKQRIKSQFFVDVFMMLSSMDYSKMTAYEVAKRHQEKMLVLGPVLQRLEKEVLDNIITLAFKYALKAGVFPPIPEALQGQELKITYVSIVAQAQKASGTAAIEQTLNFAANMSAQGKPEILDQIDGDKTFKEYADKLGTSSILASEEQVQSLRQSRAEQMQAQQQAQGVQNLLTGAKQASDIKLNQGSALDALVGGQQ